MTPFNLRIRVGDLVAFITARHAINTSRVVIAERTDSGFRLAIRPSNVPVIPELARRVELALRAWEREVLRGMKHATEDTMERYGYVEYGRIPEDLWVQVYPGEEYR